LLALTCYNFKINNIGLLDRELLFIKEFNDQQQAEKIINDYLLNFDEVQQIKEDNKPNDIKYYYCVRDRQSGLYYNIGFNFNNIV